MRWKLVSSLVNACTCIGNIMIQSITRIGPNEVYALLTMTTFNCIFCLWLFFSFSISFENFKIVMKIPIISTHKIFAQATERDKNYIKGEKKHYLFLIVRWHFLMNISVTSHDLFALITLHRMPGKCWVAWG